MTHPGEQFYPLGVRWDDAIARGTLPDLLSTAAAEYGARPLRRLVQQTVEDKLSDAVLAGEFQEGETVVIDVAEDEIILRHPTPDEVGESMEPAI
mgnify:CR=1 FL=1